MAAMPQSCPSDDLRFLMSLYEIKEIQFTGLMSSLGYVARCGFSSAILPTKADISCFSALSPT
jgi:hypothetical protein